MRIRDLSLTTVLSLFALLSCPAGSQAADPSYDVVIANGRIVDGSGNPCSMAMWRSRTATSSGSAKSIPSRASA